MPECRNAGMPEWWQRVWWNEVVASDEIWPVNDEMAISDGETRRIRPPVILARRPQALPAPINSER